MSYAGPYDPADPRFPDGKLPRERDDEYVRRETDTGRCESCNGLHSDCGDA